MSEESSPPEATKDRYVDCKNPADIIVSKAIDGLPQRMINNETLAELEKAGALRKLVLAFSNGMKYKKFTGASMASLVKSALAMSRNSDITFAQAIMSANAPMIIQKSMIDGKPTEGVLPSGQVAGVLDSLMSCEDIIQSIVAEANERLAALSSIQKSGA